MAAAKSAGRATPVGRTPLGRLVGWAMFNALSWTFLISVEREIDASATKIVSVGSALFVVIVCYFVYEAVLRAVRASDLVGIVGSTATAVSIILWSFTILYWSYGSLENFGERLSKIDAFYFAVATLTTTGYGDIKPITGEARMLVALQMLLDLVLFAVAVSLLVSAIGNRSGSK